VGSANSWRKPRLHTLLTGAPERPIFGEDYVTAVFTNLTVILQDSHLPEFCARNTIGAARRVVSATWPHPLWPVVKSAPDACLDLRRRSLSSSKRLISCTNSRSFTGSCSFAASSQNCSQRSLIGSSKGEVPKLNIAYLGNREVCMAPLVASLWHVSGNTSCSFSLQD